MITEIEIENGGFYSPVLIAPESANVGTWITVLIGENGTRKSLLLRLITEAALGQSRFPSSGKVSARIALREQESELFRKIIAISGTPLDRFPRAGATNIKAIRRSKRYRERFVYFGQRASNGMSGVAQCERSLVGALIENRHALKSRSEILRLVFGKLSLEPYVGINLSPSTSTDSDIFQYASEGTNTTFSKKLLQEARSVFERLNISSDDDAKQLWSALHTIELLASSQRVVFTRRALRELNPDKRTLAITTSGVRSRPETLTTDEWEALLRFGIVEVSGTSFRRMANIEQGSEKAIIPISGEALSSGQWNWLSSFVGLGLEAQPHSLVLIDEPENSLHPSWQLEYVPMLENLLNRFSDCQVIIATHSPLIASGVAPSCGNVRVLKHGVDKKSGDILVHSEDVECTYGWTASDVYESTFNIHSTRAPSFSRTANEALILVRKGKNISAEISKNLVDLLFQDMSCLPQFDPMRDVLQNISHAVEKLVSKPTSRKK